MPPFHLVKGGNMAKKKVVEKVEKKKKEQKVDLDNVVQAQVIITE